MTPVNPCVFCGNADVKVHTGTLPARPLLGEDTLHFVVCDMCGACTCFRDPNGILAERLDWRRAYNRAGGAKR